MNEVFFIIIIGLLLGIVFFLIAKKDNKESGVSLREDLKGIKDELKEAREKNIEFLQYQSKESRDIVKDITSQLEKLHSDHEHVKDVKQQLGKLTDILANPKQRGILGEYFLETLLKNVFQPGQYQYQYEFKNGDIVDAVIFIKDKILPVDAKFSLENYNKILEEKNPERRGELEKIFKQDLKNRIEETAKYIRPDEGTMDFAFMFIPSEGIYYDLLVNQVGGIKISTSDLIEYAFKQKKVIIVSPTSFYAYLQTVMQGLRALKIEESAQEIIKRVGGLQKHLLNYDEFLKKLGNNLTTVVNAYNQTYKEFAKIDKDVAKLTEGEEQVEPLQIDKPNP
ncbi:MAG: DNA recombination protein RmuC [Candidatus Nealsonbacteria bacterium CG23_combo_of_CG06-09_8_20_14_all_39_17]|uniref:DNA recombination protein RmuC n=1 Tax=Candidatus Nealsonbacteria bacterium CG23_combo_of_CG06-09_8_20_14_all_39_17 TaxID=1974722 RepID=A0A2G9YW60_9BACT|nr:MAG: DNA recombination protein RmuC [Candidatus Nealsonbacteria bacterium CG23_combo_of_CG06-09_8_20_14_all_39_17]PIU44177.1 MAG: DNA recombination protein RmuC [Candidatus Nealsonbacteria bacterium CG07_land_8_20_14_0_80_39_13]